MWRADRLRAAEHCIARSFETMRIDRWTSVGTDGDTRQMAATALHDSCQLHVSVTVGAAGKVTAVETREGDCEF